MIRTEEHMKLDFEFLRECIGYSGTNNKPDGAYIKETERFFNINKIKRLIERGADVNAKDDDGWTPLHYAASNNYLEITNFLISVGANVNAKNNIGQSPLHYVKNLALAKLLISAGADVNSKDNTGWTPLYNAVSSNILTIAEYLISVGANVNAKTNSDTSILYWATLLGYKEIEALLKKHGAII